jgi:hypothetical protein
MTLIEVILAAAIMTIVTGAIFATVIRSQNAFNQGVTQMKVQSEANKLMGKIIDLIRESKVLSVADNGCSITLQRPVDHDGDDDVVSDDWETEYGYTWLGTDYLDATLEIVFEVTGTSTEGSLDSDLNQDGDQVDVFTSGVLRRRYYDDNGDLQHEVTFSGDLVFVGDVDGDSTIDPLFQRVNHGGIVDASGRCVLAMFLILSVAPDGYPHVMDLATIVTPRNP